MHTIDKAKVYTSFWMPGQGYVSYTSKITVFSRNNQSHYKLKNERTLNTLVLIDSTKSKISNE